MNKFKFEVIVTYEVNIEPDDIKIAEQKLKESWDAFRCIGGSSDIGLYEVTRTSKKLLNGCKIKRGKKK